MKNILKTCSTTKRKQILTILFLTGILSVSSELLFIASSSATINHIIPTLIAQFFSEKTDQALPPSVTQAIFKDISRREGISVKKIKVIAYSQRNWRNGCLEVPQPKEFCTQVFVNGWQVIASDNKQRWRYHTNRDGSNLRLADTNIPSNQELVNLPTNVRQSVLQVAARRLNLSASQLVIMQVSQENWKDGCFELGGLNQACTTAFLSGWKVVVGAPEQVLVYHVNQTGSVIKLNESASEINIANLPTAIGNTVIKDAQQRLGIDKSQLRITKTQPITTDSCLNLPKTGEFCTQISLKAWQVYIQGNKQRLVYHVQPDGEQVRLNIAASQITLPASVSKRVVRQASQISGLPKKSLKIVKSQPQEWERNCVDQPCESAKISGWEVIVATDKERLVFLSDRRGKFIQQVNRLNVASQNILPTKIVERVLAQASREARLPVNQLQVVGAQRQQWTDSCLGTEPQNPVCNPEMITGWQITISDGKNKWVYRVGEMIKIKLEVL